MNIPNRYDAALSVAVGAAFVAAAALVWSRTGCAMPVGCETDGHFMIAARLSCGLFERSYDWGPLYPLLTAWVGSLAPSHLVAGKLVNLAAGAWLAVLTYLFGAMFFKRRLTALVAALLVVTNGYLLRAATMACTDMAMTAALATALFFAMLAREKRGGWVAALAAGLMVMIAVTIRFQAYPFAAGMALTLLFLSPQQLPARLGRVAWFALGFALPYVLVMAWLNHHGVGDWRGFTGWDKVLGVLNDFPGSPVPGAPPVADPFFETIRRFGVSVLFVGRMVVFVPLLGLLALPAALRRDSRQTLAALVPLGAYFAGVAWFPTLQHDEMMRLFLPLVPALALGLPPAVRQLARLVKAPGRAKPMIAVALIAFAAFQAWWTIPGLSSHAPGANERGFCSPQNLAAVDAAIAFDDEFDFGCAPVSTGLIGATAALPCPRFTGYGPPTRDMLGHHFAEQQATGVALSRFLLIDTKDIRPPLDFAQPLRAGDALFALRPLKSDGIFTLFAVDLATSPE